MGYVESFVDIIKIVLIATIVICVLGGAFIYYKMNTKNNQKSDTNKVKKVDPNVPKEAIKNFKKDFKYKIKNNERFRKSLKKKSRYLTPRVIVLGSIFCDK